jgi:arginyl-tRNA synthetase
VETLLRELADHFSEAIRTTYPHLPPEATVAEVAASTHERFGHYQCNNAMKLAAILGQPPRVIAAQIREVVTHSASLKPLVAAVEIAGPGFLNITLSPEFLSRRTLLLREDPRLGVPPLPRPLRVVVEFSSPNTAKEMHVGHLRSTIIGDCLARVLEFLGHDVLRLNHVGDWGTQFGMLIAYLKSKAPEILSGGRAADLPQLMVWYREAKVRFDADQEFKKRAQQEVVALQGGDRQSLAAWERICAISRRGYQEIYDLLEVQLTERGESTYNSVLQEIVDELEAKKLITISGGAKCLYLEGFTNREGDPLPLIVQKSDGGFLYATTDLAALRQRVRDERAQWLIYVIDAGQSTHMAMVFAAAERAGFVDRLKVRLDHVPFGLVLGPDGKKFRTRSGETERLIDLLTTAVDKARAILIQRGVQMTPSELEETARALGLGAVKYADLSCHRLKDYSFSYERMLRFEGNTAAFLLYSFVRIHGIKRKIGAAWEEAQREAEIWLDHPSEIALGLHLCRFAETLDGVTRDLLPNRLTDYLYGLAERFNAFFRDCRVEGSPEQNRRVLLCDATARVLAKGLDLLGLKTVQRM